jgi:PEP-CTERM motif
MRLISLPTVALAFSLAAGVATAGTLYDNGPINGQLEAFTINSGYAVADSFTAPAGAHVTGLSFVTWNTPGDTLTSVDWEITSGNPISGGPFTVLGSGTATSTATDIGGNSYSYDLQTNVIMFSPVTLSGGDYWFQLQNASIPNGDPIYWDENNGPSAAWQTGTGDISLSGDTNCTDFCTGSETFQVLGSAAPEPAAWALMLLGFGGVGAGLRSRRNALAG